MKITRALISVSDKTGIVAFARALAAREVEILSTGGTLKTLVGEARIVTSAKNLILVESTEGRVEILLPNGRLIVVEPGKAEIVGRAVNT